MNWKLGKLIKNKTYKLWGVNIFDYQWTDTGETVHLKTTPMASARILPSIPSMLREPRTPLPPLAGV